jgi:hypothetical protein
MGGSGKRLARLLAMSMSENAQVPAQQTGHIPRADWALYYALERRLRYPSIRQQSKTLRRVAADELRDIGDRTLRKHLAADRRPPAQVDSDGWRQVYGILTERFTYTTIDQERRPAFDAILSWVATQILAMRTQAQSNRLVESVWRRAWQPDGWAMPKELPDGRLRLPMERYLYRLGRQVRQLSHPNIECEEDPQERPQAAYLFWRSSDAPGTPYRRYDSHLRRFCSMLPGPPDLRSIRPQPTPLPSDQLPAHSISLSQLPEAAPPWLPSGARSAIPRLHDLVMRQVRQPTSDVHALMQTPDRWEIAYEAAALNQQILGLLWWLYTPGDITPASITWSIGNDLIRGRGAERQKRRAHVLAQHAALCGVGPGGTLLIDRICADLDWP